MEVKGALITFEGIDACGKSTQASLLVRALEARGVPVVHTREPGGTELGREIRRLVLYSQRAEIPAVAEALLMAADRADHVERVVLPALRRGQVVVSERFADSTEAYQGYGGQVPLEVIRCLNAIATRGLEPTVTFLLDLDPEEAVRRRGGPADRLEARDRTYHQRVRQGYLEIQRRSPQRVVLVDASAPAEEVHRAIVRELERREILPGQGGEGP